MDHNENRTRANLAEGDVAVLFFFSNFALIGNVPNGNGTGIVEHKLRRLEIDIMLGEIFLPLPLIALETHRATSSDNSRCTYSCQYILWQLKSVIPRR